jgi:hypothetical protein
MAVAGGGRWGGRPVASYACGAGLCCDAFKIRGRAEISKSKKGIYDVVMGLGGVSRGGGGGRGDGRWSSSRQHHAARRLDDSQTARATSPGLYPRGYP